MNDLELILEITPSERLNELMSKVLNSRFLQFSSSYSTLTGFVGEQPIVRATTDFNGPPVPEYLIAPETSVQACIGAKPLEFRLRAGSNNSLQGRRP